MTIAAGQVVAENGKMTAVWDTFTYPEEALNTVKLEANIQAQDLELSAPIAEGTIGARIIHVTENHVETKEKHVQVNVQGGKVVLPVSGEVCKIAVLEQHKQTGNRAVALVGGIGFTSPAAIAMTVAHDSHNLLIIGNDDALMAEAGNRVIRMQGGVAVVTDAGVTEFPLRIAGLMSVEPFEVVAEQSAAVSEALQSAGCTLNNAFMTLSLLALVVIPELRLSDIGLVRISAEGIERVSLFDEPHAGKQEITERKNVDDRLKECKWTN